MCFLPHKNLSSTAATNSFTQTSAQTDMWSVLDDKPEGIKLSECSEVDEVWVREVWRKSVIEAGRIGECPE